MPGVLRGPRLRLHPTASGRPGRVLPRPRHARARPGDLAPLPRGRLMPVDRTSSEFRGFVELYDRASLLELGSLADQARWQLHPEHVVSYIIDRNINYTNVCVADCKFCAFYRRPKHTEGYVLSFEKIGRKIDELKALGGVQILIQGGHNPYIPFAWYLDLLRYIKQYHPIHIHGFSPSEVDFFAGRFGMTIDEVIRELVAAGLDSIPGGGGEILVQEVRDRVARKKAGADRWLEVMETAHRRGHLPAHPGDRADRARQRPQHPGVVGDDGPEDRSGGAAVRGQRLRLPHDGGERRLRRGHHVAHDAPRDAAADRGRGIHPPPAPQGLPPHRRGGLTWLTC